jgi:hypothetical protein
MSGTSTFPHPFAKEVKDIKLVEGNLAWAKWVAVRGSNGKWEVRISLSAKICKVAKLDEEEHVFADPELIVRKGRKLLDIEKIKELTNASEEVLALYDAV